MSCVNHAANSSCSADSCLGPFTGSNCDVLTCSNPILRPQDRVIANAGRCETCDVGWTGMGCNVCTTDLSCQNAISANSNTADSPVSLIPSGTSLSSVVCNTTPRVYTSGAMTCDVDNPTISAVFAGKTVLSIQKSAATNSGSLSYPYNNLLQGGGSASAQLWFTPSSPANSTPIEQFYCSATSCSQKINSKKNLNSFICQDLECKCIPGTVLCGGGSLDLTGVIDGLSGELTVDCSTDSSNGTCAFKQETLNGLFGSQGLGLAGCGFGECVLQTVIDSAVAEDSSDGTDLSPGVIVGLAIVGVLVAVALVGIFLGWLAQRKAKRTSRKEKEQVSVGVRWKNINYSISTKHRFFDAFAPTTTTTSRRRRVTSKESIIDKSDSRNGEITKYPSEKVKEDGSTNWLEEQPPLISRGVVGEKQILSNVSGYVPPGQMLAILGASGTGKSTLLDILCAKRKQGKMSGDVYLLPNSTNETSSTPTIAFVDQTDTLPAYLTVREALSFAANLRLPENIPRTEVDGRVWEVLEQLGLRKIADSRIGDGERRGISGGERRRLAIGLELLAKPNVLFLDEPTSGLDSTGAANVIDVLKTLAKENNTTIIASIHQPSSYIFHAFDHTLLLGHGQQLYSGPTQGAIEHFSAHGYSMPSNYNPADYLLEISYGPNPPKQNGVIDGTGNSEEKQLNLYEVAGKHSKPVTTILTQFETLGAREILNLRRNYSLVLMHNILAVIIGVFVGGLFYQVDHSISGFQNRVGSLFFFGSLLAFSSLSALSNFVTIRDLFLKERAAAYYSPVSWLLSRITFDLIPLRIIPTVILAIIIYFMVGLAKGVAPFFKYLLILVLYNIVTTLFALTLAAFIRNGGTAILIAGVLTLFQMAFAGFFINLASMTPVLRWLQYLCPLRYTLEALTVNEVRTGLQIQDSLQGVSINISATLIMKTLFGFDTDSYARNVVIVFAYLVLFAIILLLAVLRLRELR